MAFKSLRSYILLFSANLALAASKTTTTIYTSSLYLLFLAASSTSEVLTRWIMVPLLVPTQLLPLPRLSRGVAPRPGLLSVGLVVVGLLLSVGGDADEEC